MRGDAHFLAQCFMRLRGRTALLSTLGALSRQQELDRSQQKQEGGSEAQQERQEQQGQLGPALVRELLRLGADACATDEFRWTPLHWARDAQTVEALLEAGADVDAAEANSLTPLHHAARDGHVGAALALLAAGANVGAAGQGGETPLHWARNALIT